MAPDKDDKALTEEFQRILDEVAELLRAGKLVSAKQVLAAANPKLRGLPQMAALWGTYYRAAERYNRVAGHTQVVFVQPPIPCPGLIFLSVNVRIN